MSESDERSRKAFEITKNVTESNADTLANVRSGGQVGELKATIIKLQADLKAANDERDDYKECYETDHDLRIETQAENKRLREANQSFGNVLAVTHRDGGHYITKHGHDKASKDAIKVILDLRDQALTPHTKGEQDE